MIEQKDMPNFAAKSFRASISRIDSLPQSREELDGLTFLGKVKCYWNFGAALFLGIPFVVYMSFRKKER